MTLQLHNVSAVVKVAAELDPSSVDDVIRCEERIVSQWREVPADQKHQLRDQVDELLRPLGFKTRLLLLERDNCVAHYFVCVTLPALVRLHLQWLSRELTNIIQSLFTFLLDCTRPVLVKELDWQQADYRRCLKFFTISQSKPTMYLYTIRIILQL